MTTPTPICDKCMHVLSEKDGRRLPAEEWRCSAHPLMKPGIDPITGINTATVYHHCSTKNGHGQCRQCVRFETAEERTETCDYCGKPDRVSKMKHGYHYQSIGTELEEFWIHTSCLIEKSKENATVKTDEPAAHEEEPTSDAQAIANASVDKNISPDNFKRLCLKLVANTTINGIETEIEKLKPVRSMNSDRVIRNIHSIINAYRAYMVDTKQ